MPLDTINKVAEKLNFLHKPEQIFYPKGIGAQVYANSVKEKIGKVIKRKFPNINVETGILVADPNSGETQHPIAIICEFSSAVEPKVISLAHRLCWNFCRAPLLIIIEPNLVRAFSCYERPIQQKQNSANNQLYLLDDAIFHHPKPVKKFYINEISDEAKEATNALQWVELVSGNFFQKEKRHFPRQQRADKTLLENLQDIRKKLLNTGLESDTTHDLLARLIFIQFLFQREDSNGQTAISSNYLKRLYETGEFTDIHEDLPSILRNYNDAYKLFRLLNKKFNGDLFPGDREEAWQAEMAKVNSTHLTMLAAFVKGDIHLEKKQPFLWQMYSFDVIPLEFISSIYEQFVSQDQNEKEDGGSVNSNQRETGVYYTKSHLVDFILDNVLPWSDQEGKSEWDLKILDPSCGSGIFLVKAFQRLVQRWKKQKSELNEKYDSKELVQQLTHLLKNNLFGVDVDPAAVRVASFSLYLAMCDEIDPRTLWEEATFPNLRDTQIVPRDFFDDEEDKPLFKQNLKYDLIIGNAPWGEGTLKKSKYARAWAENQINDWEISNNDIGTLFLPKAATLVKENGYISLIQPALPLLTGALNTAENFRKKLFKKYKIEEIVNLSDLRRHLFEKAVSPLCIVTMRGLPPNGEPINYICPKRRGTDEDYMQIIIEPMDVNFVRLDEAINKPWIWAALMWGSRRDVALIDRLSQYPTVEMLEKEKRIQKRRGIYRPRGEGELHEEILGRLMLEDSNFPENTFLKLHAQEELKPNKNPYVSKKDTPPLNTFEPSQVFLKLGWTQENWRFQAAYVENSDKKGVLCKSAYYNIQSDQIDLLKSIAATCNSNFTSYYLFLTNGRCAFYRPEPSGESFWQVPIPSIPERSLEALELLGKSDKAAGLKKLDQTVLTSLELNESEKILVDDHFKYTLRDYKGNTSSDGRQITTRGNELDLTQYCETFIKVIKAGFGQDKEVRATIFQENNTKHLPIRIIAIHLDFPERNKCIEIKNKYEGETLWNRLKKLNEIFLQNTSETGNIFYQRVARIYQNMEFEDKQIPTVYLVKPDQKRYWLRSQALHDADEVAADIIIWNQRQRLAASDNQDQPWRAKQKKIA